MSVRNPQLLSSCIILGTVAVLLGVFVSNGVVRAADPPNTSLRGRLDLVAGERGAGFQTGANVSIAATVGKIINGAMSVLGVLFVAQMVYAGFLWMNARGEEEHLTKAKKIIRRSIIGLAIILSAWGITAFVLRAFITATG